MNKGFDLFSAGVMLTHKGEINNGFDCSEE